MSKKPLFQRAVGLAFKPAQTKSTSEAPTVMVSGQELEADLIVRLARKYGIPVVEKPSVAEVLSQLPVDAEIPPELYRAVASILNELDKKN